MKLNLGILTLLIIGDFLSSCNSNLTQNTKFECAISNVSLDYNISFKYFDNSGRTRAPENIYYDLTINNKELDSLLIKENFKIGLINGNDSIQFKLIRSDREFLEKGQSGRMIFVYPYDKLEKLDVILRSDRIKELASNLSTKNYYYSSSFGDSLFTIDSLKVDFIYTDTAFNHAVRYL